jgi:exopolyphosphatase/guanosine-5'-triphosphate,3'-diphosphate pyrophosphatase
LRDGGSLDPAAIERNLAAIGEFVARSRARGATTIEAIATSAMRRADDSDAFAARVRALVGGELVILSGDEEATYSFVGAMADAPGDGARRAVIDIGGGSTESAVGVGLALERARSVEIGSVRLTERVPGIAGGTPGAAARAAAEDARAIVRETFAWLDAFGPIAELRAVAGTPLTIAAVARATPTLEANIGTALERSEVEDVLARLLDLDLEARRALAGMIPQRADIIVAGGIILSEVMRRFSVERARIEVNDLLLGYLLRNR